MRHHKCILAFLIAVLFMISACSSTPLIKASSNGDSLSVQKLINEGANVNEQDSNGATPLILAVKAGNTYIAKQLIEAGSDVNVKDKYKYDALIYAIDFNQVELINILLDKGADIESRDYSGATPLAHAALWKMNIDAIKILIKRGADANTRNNKSQPLFDLLLDEPAYGMMDIVAIILDANPKLLEPTKGKARLLFFGENFDIMGTVSVNVGNNIKYLSKINTLNFIDVKPGNTTIIVKVTAAGSLVPRKNTTFTLDVKADQTYYLKVIQREDFAAAGVIGSWFGQSTIGQGLSALADQVEDPFKIGLIEESVAKANIKQLLNTSK